MLKSNVLEWLMRRNWGRGSSASDLIISKILKLSDKELIFLRHSVEDCNVTKQHTSSTSNNNVDENDLFSLEIDKIISKHF